MMVYQVMRQEYPDGLHRGEQEAVFVIVQRRLVGGS
jgi:hypothetical protein